MTFAALAKCLADERCVQQLPVGDDFLDDDVLPKHFAMIPPRDLLTQFILHGVPDTSLAQVPAGAEKQILRWRALASEQRASADCPFWAYEEALVELLAAAWSSSRKHEHHWLQKLTMGNGKKAMNAAAVVRSFLDFLEARGPPQTFLGDLSRRRLVVLLGWFCLVGRLEKKREPAKRQKDSKHKELSDVLARAKKMPLYVPPEDVHAGDAVHFVQDNSDPFAIPVITAPRVCELCGRGFRNNRALHKHCDSCHAGVAEYRQRVFFEAEQRVALNLSYRRKRNMLANFDREYRCSRPGGDGELEQREDVACVICACKDWSERRYRVFLWKTLGAESGEAEELSGTPVGEDDGMLPRCESDEEPDALPAAEPPRPLSQRCFETTKVASISEMLLSSTNTWTLGGITS